MLEMQKDTSDLERQNIKEQSDFKKDYEILFKKLFNKDKYKELTGVEIFKLVNNFEKYVALSPLSELLNEISTISKIPVQLSINNNGEKPPQTINEFLESIGLTKKALFTVNCLKSMGFHNFNDDVKKVKILCNDIQTLIDIKKSELNAEQKDLIKYKEAKTLTKLMKLIIPAIKEYHEYNMYIAKLNKQADEYKKLNIDNSKVNELAGCLSAPKTPKKRFEDFKEKLLSR
jgi:hypothetical protein